MDKLTTEKLIHLSVVDNLIENIYVKVSERLIRRVEPHWHDFYEIELVLKGGTVTEINGQIYDMPVGSMSLITPSDVHSYRDTGEDITVLNLVFASKSLEYNSLAANVLSGDSFVCKLPKKVFENIIFLIKKIDEESRSKSMLNGSYISYLLSCIIIELKRIKREQGMDFKENEFDAGRKALVFIRNHFKEQLTLEDVAKFMNVSTVYASRLIRQTLGYRFKEYLMDLRLEYAAGLLTYTEENISDISYYAGYNTASYFTRGFRKKYGMTPTQYREQSRSLAYKKE